MKYLYLNQMSTSKNSVSNRIVGFNLIPKHKKTYMRHGVPKKFVSFDLRKWHVMSKIFWLNLQYSCWKLQMPNVIRAWYTCKLSHNMYFANATIALMHISMRNVLGSCVRHIYLHSQGIIIPRRKGKERAPIQEYLSEDSRLGKGCS